jgi:DNA-binding CsgD family transcriptional regulator
MKQHTSRPDILLEFAMRLHPEDKEFGNEVLKILDELFGFEITTFMRVDSEGAFDDYFGHNIVIKDFDAYRRYYAKDDPFAPANRKEGTCRVYGIKDLMSYEEYEHSKIHRIISSCNVYYQVAASLLYRNKVVAVMSFFRKKEDGEFIESELELIESIAAIVEKNLEHFFYLEQYKQMAYERQAFYDILKNFGCALMLCNSHFMVYQVSENLESMLPDKIGSNSVEDYNRFIKMQLLPLYDRCNSKPFILPSYPGLSFSIHPLVIQTGDGDINSIYAVVIFPDASADSRLNQWMLGITKREKQICCLLVQQLDNKAIAEHLGISEHTCKRHIENIYRKFGVSRRRDLLKLLATENGVGAGDGDKGV